MLPPPTDEARTKLGRVLQFQLFDIDKHSFNTWIITVARSQSFRFTFAAVNTKPEDANPY